MLALAATPASAEVFGDWKVNRVTDDFEDDKQVVAIAVVGSTHLAFSCLNNSLVMAMVKLTHIDVGIGDRKFKYRVDDHPAVSVAGENASGNNGTIAFDGVAVDFARAVAGAQRRVIVRGENGRGDFPINGSTVAVGAVLRACNL
jgi:hypothetical protein